MFRQTNRNRHDLPLSPLFNYGARVNFILKTFFFILVQMDCFKGLKTRLLRRKQRRDRVFVRRRQQQQKKKHQEQQAQKIAAEIELYSKKKLKPESLPLVRYLVKNAPNFFGPHTTNLSTYDVLVALRQIVKRQGLYDPSNPNIIVCNDELAQAIGCRTIHASEVRAKINSRLGQETQEIANPSGLVSSIVTIINNDQERQPQEQPVTTVVPCWADPEARLYEVRKNVISRLGGCKITNKVYFTASENLLKVIHLVSPSVKKDNRKIFPYGEIYNTLLKYIIQNRRTVIDPTNVFILRTAGSPLGDCFKVDFLHKKQLNTFLLNELTLLYPSFFRRLLYDVNHRIFSADILKPFKIVLREFSINRQKYSESKSKKKKNEKKMTTRAAAALLPGHPLPPLALCFSL